MTTIEVFLPILLLVAVAAIWHNALGARELAHAHARRLCRDAGLQLLDETISLRRLRLRRRPGASLELVREYHFEVSANGADRLPGSLRFASGDLLGWSLPTRDIGGSGPTASAGRPGLT